MEPTTKYVLGLIASVAVLVRLLVGWKSDGEKEKAQGKDFGGDRAMLVGVFFSIAAWCVYELL